jgi:hypothetical protein
LAKDEGTVLLVASEASAGVKGGGGDCNDLVIQKDVNANAHAGMREGTGDLSDGNCEVASKITNSKIEVNRA